MTRHFLFIQILFLALAQGQELNDSLNFIDPETRSASDVDTGNGLRAIVDLPLIPDSERLDIEVLAFPEFKLDEAPLYERRYTRERSEVHGSWRKVIRIPSFRNKESIIKRFGRVGRLRISWKNQANNRSGTLIRKFYLLERKDQKFFKILSPGDLSEELNSDPESICSYRKNTEIVGPYIQNPSLSPQEYEFNQNVALETLRYRGSLNPNLLKTFGYVEKTTDIFQLKNGNELGWLMTGWTHMEGSETKLSFKPKIVLQPAQGGFFVKETLMKRFKAQKYRFNKKVGTSEWLSEELGYLDVGATQFDFLPLSREDASNPALLEANLADREKELTSCSIYPEEKDRTYHTGDSNTLHEEMYFVSLD
ncbi:MAG: hypothetical protein R3A80_11250 [Bdellovibrionota bacterium]